MTLADGSYWVYGYDRLGQVVSGKRYWQDGTPVAGQQFEYGFDDIGNRTGTKAGGDQSGAGLRPANYSANQLNRYTSRGVPSYLDILGVANPTAAVKVNGHTAYRKGDYFWHALYVDNNDTAQYPTINVVSEYSPGQTDTGNSFLARNAEDFTYDADGNLTQDGHWDYTWDGENRLIGMQTRSAVLGSGVPNQRLEFAYDPLSRRIQKKVSVWDSGNWDIVSDQRFLYDNWNLLAILGVQSTIVQSFAWGLDLSRTEQGAGGVGGLLWVSEISNGEITDSRAAGYDGNGNVMALVSLSDANVSARYEYGPFGEPLRQTGLMADANPFRFSTKFTDGETGHLYYGYRYYSLCVGRWLGRDPLLEEVGENLYRFADNDPLIECDIWGLLKYTSEGRVYYDGPWPITGQVTRSASESGLRNSTEAYFMQSVVEIRGCTGGICNSGGTGLSSSFSRASVTAEAACAVTLLCNCRVEWLVTNYTPGKRGRKNAVVRVTVLGHSDQKTYDPKPKPDGSWYAFGAGSMSRRGRITLAAGATAELYYGVDVKNTSAPEIPGAGFSESMSGSCSCEVEK